MVLARLALYLLLRQKYPLFFFSLPAPYEIKNGVRYLTGTNKLVPEKLKIIAVDENGNKFSYSSISECNRALGIGRLTIKNCLIVG